MRMGHLRTIAHSVAPTATKISFWPAVSIFDFIGSSLRLRRSSADMPGSARRTSVRVWLGDHDPPTLGDRAEGSARALGE